MLNNIWAHTETLFSWDKFAENTKNQYRFVSQRPYVSKKNPEDVGCMITLQVAHDTTDYGVDKKTGKKRDDNRLNTFDVTILNGQQELPLVKGDWVRLIDYVPEKSFVIGFDLILRFKRVEKINVEKK